MNNLPLIEVQELEEYVYTDDDYLTQAVELGLCPKFSLTLAEMRMNSMTLSWNTRTGRAKSYKQILNRTINQFPKRISFGV
tara:strand:- start:838 stop:1080 length:243 start_codon:yes stop_codon:yes gene_type:complete